MDTLISNRLDITVNGFCLKAKTWGKPNGKPILAIHGWLDNANSFNKIAPLLNDNLYIVAIDLAGHGWSQHRENNGNYYLWDYATDLLNCIDTLGWKTCSILAHSLGTGVASIIAGAFPNRVDKLVFIDGLGAPFVSKEKKIALDFKTAFQQLKMAKKTKLYGFSPKDTITFKTKADAIRDRMDNVISPISYNASKALIERGVIEVSGGYRWSHDPKIALPKFHNITEAQAQQFIKHINCDTLLILGNQGLFSNNLFHSRLNLLKKATTHWLDGNHHLHLEEAHKTIAELTNQFFKY
ncbi:alpha/beta fold hydrolase [Pontimicrobium sp. MEBiC06410]